MKNIKSFIERLNNIGPRIEPCGTPLIISREELDVDPILHAGICLRGSMQSMLLQIH